LVEDVAVLERSVFAFLLMGLCGELCELIDVGVSCGHECRDDALPPFGDMVSVRVGHFFDYSVGSKHAKFSTDLSGSFFFFFQVLGCFEENLP